MYTLWQVQMSVHAATRALFIEHPMNWVFIATYLSMIFASFSGVLADRLPVQAGLFMKGHIPMQGEPRRDVTLFARSSCPHCRGLLNPLALIPVFGWLFYRGKCHHCGHPVPSVYPIVEAVSGFAGGLMAWYLGPNLQALAVLFVFWMALPISWIDWNWHWVPDRLSLPLLFIGLSISPFATIESRVQGCVVMAAVMTAIMYGVSLRRGVDAMAVGDILLIAGAGAWVGLDRCVELMMFSGAFAMGYALPFIGLRPQKEGPNWFAFAPGIVFGLLGTLLLKNPIHYL